jgi:hypothetical protein
MARSSYLCCAGHDPSWNGAAMAGGQIKARQGVRPIRDGLRKALESKGLGLEEQLEEQDIRCGLPPAPQKGNDRLQAKTRNNNMEGA